MKSNKLNMKTIVLIGMLGAVSEALMFFNFPLPFAPSFLEFDISELPALFAGFFLGPVSGCAVVFIKIILKLIIEGTNTAFVGEFMNVTGNCSFVFCAAIIYKMHRSKKGAIAGLTIASIFASIVFVLLNAYIGLPMYDRLYGMSTEVIVSMAAAVNPLINDKLSMLIFAFLPFNLVKHFATSAVTYLVYKRCGNALRSVIANGNALSSVQPAKGDL